jgi:outer membrane protein FlgP
MKRLLTVLTLAFSVALPGCALMRDGMPAPYASGEELAPKPPNEAKLVQSMEQLAEAMAAEKRPPPRPRSPLAEQRGAISATGYAVISVQDHRTPAQQRLMAIRASKLDAYRTLTEQVFGQQMDSSTTVADALVLSDTFRARVQGIIHGARLVSIGPVGDDTYETTLSLDADMVNELRAYYLEHMQGQHQPVHAIRPLR